jgi:magnesium chelatase family protein
LNRKGDPFFSFSQEYPYDFNEVKGQEQVKRAMEISAAGGHNLIMVGPPGSGKTMLAQRLPSILPDLTFEEALETSKIYSVMGLMPADTALVTTRPFRSPHHTVSDAGLIGGGQFPRPGEVSLAHNGVLFLDEMPEFKKNVLEVLRQPLEDGKVTISRAITSLTYPARFMLVGAMNPCPCGFLSDPQRECQCTYPQIRRYKSKISGPLLDRIDLHVEVPGVKFKDLATQSEGESSEVIRERVKTARERQKNRFHGKPLYCNAQMGPRLIKKHCALDTDSQGLLEKAMDYLGLSARAYHRILKIALTIADLEQEDNIGPHHVSEAIQYRTLDRRLL